MPTDLELEDIELPVAIPDKPPHHVPSDLSKPAGAAVAADGPVRCVRCDQSIALACADIVGQGYRCAPCTQRAHVAALSSGADDVSADLSPSDRDELHRSGARLFGPGLALLVCGIVCVLAFFATSSTRVVEQTMFMTVTRTTRHDGLLNAGVLLLVAGVIGCGLGHSRMRRAGKRWLAK
jgi:hypothetical protein